MNLFIAVPSYDGKLTVRCAESILKGCHVLRDEGHRVMPFFYSGNPYIAAARNICVHEFFKSDCDEIIFIDSDVGFDKNALSQLISHDKDIVAGVYPYKQDNEGYPCIMAWDENNNCKEESSGLVYAEVVPTGFLRIRRSVFERMAEHYSMKRCADKMYSFFDTGALFPDDDKWYGEDVYFCKRWRDMGGQIFIDPKLSFVHTGTKNWSGSLHNYLMGLRVDKWQASLDQQEEGISGWTSSGELAFLSELASRSKSVVEVGSWKGRSTKALLEACPGTVYAVDNWKGSPSDMSSAAAIGKDIYAEFFGNVGHYNNLEILRGDSVEMSKCFNGSMVDMVFIDAEHTYGAAKADIEAWLPKCKKYICGHDYDYAGVKRAVDEKFPNVNVVERMWWVDLGA